MTTPSDPRTGLEQAQLDIVYRQKGAQLSQVAETIKCMFNPKELKVSRTNTWEDRTTKRPGKGINPLQFNGSGAATMDLNLFFDTTDTGESVTKYTGKIMGLLDLDTKVAGTSKRSNNARPPVVVFRWGKNFRSWPAVITTATVTFTFFSAIGVPLRATADLNLKQYHADDAFGPQNPTSGTPYPHDVHRTMPGETLDRIAAHYYGDPTRWRALAAANGIEDPLAIRPGSLIVVPEITSL